MRVGSLRSTTAYSMRLLLACSKICTLVKQLRNDPLAPCLVQDMTATYLL